MNKDKTIEQLKADLLIVERKRNIIRNKIEDVELKEVFPTHVLKYEGKYFKYDNGTSSNDRWPIYIYVKKVNFLNGYRGFSVEGFCFQKDNNGEIKIATSDLHYLMSDCVEISKGVFNRALTKIKGQISKSIGEI